MGIWKNENSFVEHAELLEPCLEEMLEAVNGLWRRRTLQWQTAEVWSARPRLSIDPGALQGNEQAMASDMRNAELIGASPLVHARAAGLVGVVTLASGSFTGFVASKLVVRGDVVATSSNIVASESLFRLGLVGSLIMMIAFMFYALLLYRLLRPVNKSHAMIMVGLVLASVPIYMLNQVNQYAALPLASDPSARCGPTSFSWLPMCRKGR